MVSFRLSGHSGTPNGMGLGVPTPLTPTILCILKVVPRVWPEPSLTRSPLSSSTRQTMRRGPQKMKKPRREICQIGRWWTCQGHRTDPIIRNRGHRLNSRPPTRRPRKRAVPVADRQELSGEAEHRPAVKIQMSPPKLSDERRAPFVLSISRRGTIFGYFHVKENIGSIKRVSTRGYWNSRALARCAVKVRW